MSDREGFLEKELKDLHVELKEVSQKQVQILKLVKNLINNQKYLLDSIQDGFKKQEFLINNFKCEMRNQKGDIDNKFDVISNSIKAVNKNLYLINEYIDNILNE